MKIVRIARGAAVAACLVATTGGAVVGSAPQAEAAASGCAPGHFCAYSGANYSGTMVDYYYCSNKYMPFTTVGSWVNNQTRGTRARFYNNSGQLIYTSPGAYSVRSSGVNWLPVFSIKPC